MGESFVDLHDTEILQIEKVLERLKEKQARGGINLEKFRQEIIERFENIGLGVNVQVFETNQAGMFAFDVDITKRLEGRFDPDRQVWETTHDVLDLGEGGIIKTDAD